MPNTATDANSNGNNPENADMTNDTIAKRFKLVVLISGNGTNLQSFIDKTKSGELISEIVAVISNKPNAYGLDRASKAGIVTEAIDHTLFESRESFDRALMQSIDNYQPDLVILAGFMRILTSAFVQHYSGRLMNIHPSLLPKYPGLKTHQRAIDAGDNETGATVHFVTEQLDGGAPIIQAAVPICKKDTADTLAASTMEKEYIIYPLAAQWFAEGRLSLTNQYAVLDNERLPTNGYQFSA